MFNPVPTLFVRLADDWDAKWTAAGPVECRYLDAVILKGLQSVQDGIEDISHSFRFRPEGRNVVRQEYPLSDARHHFIENTEALQMAVLMGGCRMRPSQLNCIGG